MVLRNYRGVADCEVEFPAQGVTIVEGPNEVGKTSIPEGLDLLLTRMDSSRHRHVRSVKPVGRDVGPDVEIEMSTGQYRFVYRKRWLRRPETVLNILAPRHEQFTGRPAHKRVEEILDETLDRDLWRALRIEQGTELALPSFDVPSLVEALDRAASGADPADEDDDLWTRICEQRDRYWTPTGRSKKYRNDEKAAVGAAQSQVTELEQRLENIDRDATEVSRLETEARRLATTRDKCDQRARELNEAWDATEELRSNVDHLTAACDTATLRRDSIASEQKRRRDLIDELNSRAEELEKLQARAEQSVPALAAAIKQRSETATALEEARTNVSAAEAEQRRAREDRDHHRNRIEVEQLSERYDRIVEAEKRLRHADTLLASARVDDELLEQIEQAHLAVVGAEAAVASVETTALRELSVAIDGEGVTLDAGETKRTVVDDDVVLSFPDVAEIRVRAGTGSESLAVERRHAQEELRRLCAEASVGDQAEARQAAEQRKEAQRQRRYASNTIKRDLRDLTVDILRGKIEGLTKRIDTYAAARPEDPPLPSDFEIAKQIARGKARSVEARRADFETCELAAASATNALHDEQVNESKLGGMIEIARSAKGQAADSLELARSRRADSQITADLVEAEESVCAARESLKDAEAQLSAADPESITVRLANTRRVAQDTRSTLSANETRQTELRISLSLRGEKGLHTRHEEAVRRLRHLERKHQGTEARAEAALLLHDTFSRRRQEARQRYSGPFKQRIEQLCRIVFNPSFSVDIDESLRIVRRTLDGDTLQVDQLSAGALEQLAVISRLACAAIVSPDGCGAPVIIDDALGWSDPDRLERMGAAIAAAGGQSQVIILTCTPARYAHIGNATTIRLPAI